MLHGSATTVGARKRENQVWTIGFPKHRDMTQLGYSSDVWEETVQLALLLLKGNDVVGRRDATGRNNVRSNLRVTLIPADCWGKAATYTKGK